MVVILVLPFNLLILFYIYMNVLMYSNFSIKIAQKNNFWFNISI